MAYRAVIDAGRQLESYYARILSTLARIEAARYVELAPEAQAEVVKICTVARFLEIQAAAAALQAEFDAALLAYEGPQGLPRAEE